MDVCKEFVVTIGKSKELSKMIRFYRLITPFQWVIVMIAIVAITVSIWSLTIKISNNFCIKFCIKCWEERKYLIEQWIKRRILFLPRSEIICHHSCKGNLKQLGLAILLYASDHDGYLPNHRTWEQQIFNYLKNRDIYRCPDALIKQKRYYCMNSKLSNRNYKNINLSQNIVLLYECDDNGKPINRHHYMEFKHLCNVVFVNGQVKGLLPKEVERLLK